MSHPHIRVIDTALYINRSQNEIGKAPPQSKNFSTAKSKADYSSEPAPLRLAAGKTASLSVTGVQKSGNAPLKKRICPRMHRHCRVLAFPVFVTSVFFKISAITQFTLLLYKVYHCFLTFSSVQDIFFKIFSIFLNLGCSGNGKQVI